MAGKIVVEKSFLEHLLDVALEYRLENQWRRYGGERNKKLMKELDDLVEQVRFVLESGSEEDEEG